ncbi:hypothetical protein ACFY4C_37450 [Actinomadura viridis]|uniref:hypothetical protein n=1 Tax=Actinomadura viridis TaxID=58110 RepID=UPI003673BC53
MGVICGGGGGTGNDRELPYHNPTWRALAHLGRLSERLNRGGDLLVKQHPRGGLFVHARDKPASWDRIVCLAHPDDEDRHWFFNRSQDPIAKAEEIEVAARKIKADLTSEKGSP